MKCLPSTDEETSHASSEKSAQLDASLCIYMESKQDQWVSMQLQGYDLTEIM